MTILTIQIFRGGKWTIRGEAPSAGTIEEIKASAPSYATQHPHRFLLDGALVHEHPAPKRCRKL